MAPVAGSVPPALSRAPAQVRRAKPQSGCVVALEVADVLLRKADLFGELFLSHASGLPNRKHIAANERSHVHRDVDECSLSPSMCIELLAGDPATMASRDGTRYRRPRLKIEVS